MSKYPTVPTELPNVFGDFQTALVALETAKIGIYKFRPVKPSNKLSEHTATAMRKLADELEAYESERAEFDYWATTARDYNAAIDQKIEDTVKRDAGFYKIPELYRDKVWRKAWADGHSGGWSEVFGQLCELVDIFQ